MPAIPGAVFPGDLPQVRLRRPTRAGTVSGLGSPARPWDTVWLRRQRSALVWPSGAPGLRHPGLPQRWLFVPGRRTRPPKLLRRFPQTDQRQRQRQCQRRRRRRRRRRIPPSSLNPRRKPCEESLSWHGAALADCPVRLPRRLRRPRWPRRHCPVRPPRWLGSTSTDWWRRPIRRMRLRAQPRLLRSRPLSRRPPLPPPLPLMWPESPGAFRPPRLPLPLRPRRPCLALGPRPPGKFHSSRRRPRPDPPSR